MCGICLIAVPKARSASAQTYRETDADRGRETFSLKLSGVELDQKRCLSYAAVAEEDGLQEIHSFF